mgnify:CR=1 FL=1
MSKQTKLINANNDELNEILSEYEVNTLHTTISALTEKLRLSEIKEKNSINKNNELKKSVDSLSAELGKVKRKLKREANKWKHY